MIFTELTNLVLLTGVILKWNPMEGVWCGIKEIDIFSKEKRNVIKSYL